MLFNLHLIYCNLIGWVNLIVKYAKHKLKKKKIKYKVVFLFANCNIAFVLEIKDLILEKHESSTLTVGK